MACVYPHVLFYVLVVVCVCVYAAGGGWKLKVPTSFLECAEGGWHSENAKFKDWFDSILKDLVEQTNMCQIKARGTSPAKEVRQLPC